jgi:hypothetical protein
MAAMDLAVEAPDSGCCGMAGSFGYEAGEHYDVSMAAGERVILPAVRGLDDDTVVLADGFSCRSQIRAGTGRQPRHLAELLAGDRAERTDPPGHGSRRPAVATGLGALAVALGAAAWLRHRPVRGRPARRSFGLAGRARGSAAR